MNLYQQILFLLLHILWDLEWHLKWSHKVINNIAISIVFCSLHRTVPKETYENISIWIVFFVCDNVHTDYVSALCTAYCSLQIVILTLHYHFVLRVCNKYVYAVHHSQKHYDSIWLAYYCAMLCVSAVFAVTQCLSVCLSRWWIVSTRLKISSNFLFSLVAPSF